jgi:hypothetical protein
MNNVNLNDDIMNFNSMDGGDDKSVGMGVIDTVSVEPDDRSVENRLNYRTGQNVKASP